MKFLQIALITLVFSLNPLNYITKQVVNFEYNIKKWQENLNHDFKDKEHSPLTDEGFDVFTGLEFYKISKELRVEAKLTFTPYEQVFEMKTTTERLPRYKKFGIATFQIQGQVFELSVFQNQDLILKEGYQDFLFIPYTDLTSGNTSYGGGKYIDVRIPKKDILIIDFNKSYNPYCAYNHKYSCPIPPAENNLKIRIEAGVMNYKDLDTKSSH